MKNVNEEEQWERLRTWEMAIDDGVDLFAPAPAPARDLDALRRAYLAAPAPVLAAPRPDIPVRDAAYYRGLTPEQRQFEQYPSCGIAGDHPLCNPVGIVLALCFWPTLLACGYLFNWW